MNLITRLFESRVRGFRVIEIASFAVLLMLVFGVYLAKAAASRERARIAQVEQQIAEEDRRLRGLRAEVAHLEQPSRLEALSSAYLALQPVDPAREAAPAGLGQLRSAPMRSAPSPLQTAAAAESVR